VDNHGHQRNKPLILHAQDLDGGSLQAYDATTTLSKSDNAGMTYPFSDSYWVSLVQVVPKNGGIVVVKNDNIKFLLE